MRNKGFNSIGQVEQYFLDQILPTLNARDLKMLCWQELFQNGVSLPSSAIVQVWKDAPTLDAVLSAGHKGIFSYGWYLDQQIPDPPSTHYEWEDTYIVRST
jgi:N-acetyl-beta-hexosaminidase